MSTETKSSNKIEVLSLLVVSIFTTYLWLIWDFDDAFIVYRMVENLINSGEWSYNLGEKVNASTSVLNTLVLYVVCLIGKVITGSYNIPLTAHIIGGISLFFCGYCSYKIFVFHKIKNYTAVIFSSFIIFFLGNKGIWGIETIPFLSLVLYYCYLELKNPASNKGILLGFLILLRPDAMIFPVLKAGEILYRKRRAAKRELISTAIATGVVLLPWVVFSLVVFHEIFPSTFSEKVWQGNSGFWGQGFIYLESFISSFLNWKNLLLLGAGSIGFLVLFYLKSSLLHLIVFAVAQQVVYIFLNVPAYHWYSIAFEVSLILASAFTAEVVIKTLVEKYDQINSNVSGLRFASASVAVLVFCIVPTLVSGTEFKVDSRTASYVRAINQIESAVAGQEGDVAILEVGAPGFYTSRNVVDISGLVSENPQYISSDNLDLFFKEPPLVVLMHEPLWHFERALAEDVRFKILYKKSQFIEDPFFPMKFFTRRNKASLSKAELKSFIKKNYNVASKSSIASKLNVTAGSNCILDQLNGNMADTFEVKGGVISVNGWATFDKFNSDSVSLEMVLSKEQDLGKATNFSFKLDGGVSRQDVADNLGDQMFANSGFKGTVHVDGIAKGTYSIWIKGNLNNNSQAYCRVRQQVAFK